MESRQAWNWRCLDHDGGGILTSSRRVKISYRLLRNPLILFGLAPLFLFFVLERFPSSKCKPRGAARYLMNFTLLLWGVVMSLILGSCPG